MRRRPSSTEVLSTFCGIVYAVVVALLSFLVPLLDFFEDTFRVIFRSGAKGVSHPERASFNGVPVAPEVVAPHSTADR
jgi:hypothetical protein